MGSCMTLWYLSYADEHSFRGAVLIDAPDFIAACALARRRGLSPGGQVLGCPVRSQDRPPESKIGVLMPTKEAVNAAMGEYAGGGVDLNDKQLDQFKSAGLIETTSPN